jgi:hypothetical protein
MYMAIFSFQSTSTHPNKTAHKCMVRTKKATYRIRKLIIVYDKNIALTLPACGDHIHTLYLTVRYPQNVCTLVIPQHFPSHRNLKMF